MHIYLLKHIFIHWIANRMTKSKWYKNSNKLRIILCGSWTWLFSFAQDARFLTHSQQLFLSYKPFLHSGKQIIPSIFTSALHTVGEGHAFSNCCGWVCWHQENSTFSILFQMKNFVRRLNFCDCYTYKIHNWLYWWKN